MSTFSSFDVSDDEDGITYNNQDLCAHDTPPFDNVQSNVSSDVDEDENCEKSRQAEYAKRLTDLCATENVTLADIISNTDVFTWLMNEANSMTCRSVCEPWLVDLVATTDCVRFYEKHIQNFIQCCVTQLNIRYVSTFTKFHLVMWNCTDKSPKLCSKLTVVNVHKTLFTFLQKSELCGEFVHNPKVMTLAHCSIGILHNIIGHLPYIRYDYRNSNAVLILSEFTVEPDVTHQISENDVSFRTAALFLLAAVVDESENLKIHADDSHIVHVLEMLRDALNSSPNYYSSSHGYHADEILRSLVKLASPDSNKETMFKNKALDLAMYALDIAKHLKMKERDRPAGRNDTKLSCDLLAALSLELIWQLLFLSTCREYMAQSCELVSVCESFSDVIWSPECQKSAQGIRWNLNSTKSEFIINSEGGLCFNQSISRPDGHIMISYQHSTQSKMIMLQKELTGRGYRVWIDVDHMSHGSFVDEMAKGILGACVLVPGLCQAFKDSPHCRQEMLYAYELKIPLYPVLLEKDYRPDGWLSLLLATQIHLEGFEDNQIPDVAEKIGKRLGNIGKIQTRMVPESAPPYGKNISAIQIHQRSQSACLDSNFMRSVALPNSAKEPAVRRVPLNLSTNYSPFPADQHFGTPSMHPAIGMIPGSGRSTVPLSEGIFHRNIPTPDITAPVSTTSCADTFHDGIEPSWKSPSSSLSDNFLLAELPSPKIRDWSAEKVSKWVKDWELETYANIFADFEGCHLYELAKWRVFAPETFVSMLNSELGFSFSARLRFSYALSQLSMLPAEHK